MTNTGMAKLIERLEKGSGEDRELDALVWASSLPETGDGIDGYGLPDATARYEYEPDDRGAVSMYVCWPDGKATKRAKKSAPPLTSSLDAALAFAEAVLGPIPERPNCGVELNVHSSTASCQIIHDTLGSGHSPTPARAVLIATLRALAAKDTTDGD